MIFQTFKQLQEAINKFDFSSLEFHHHSNPIFWNSDTETFEAWTSDTSIEIAEQQNSVLHVGYLTPNEAKEGKKPKPNEIRIKTHYTREIY